MSLKEANEAGWKIIDKKILCPKHAREAISGVMCCSAEECELCTR